MAQIQVKLVRSAICLIRFIESESMLLRLNPSLLLEGFVQANALVCAQWRRYSSNGPPPLGLAVRGMSMEQAM